MQKKKNAVIQISLLFLIQWLSITVIVLNALALNASKDSNQGLIMAIDTGPQDFILLILGAASLFAVSLLLCLYLQMFFRLLGNYPNSPSKKVLGTEVAFSVIIIALWTSATAIILTHFNESSSCRKTNISTLSPKISFDNPNNNKLSSSACNLVDAMIIVAFMTTSLWFITLVVSIYSLVILCNHLISDLFTMETPIHPYENVKLQISRRNSATTKHMIDNDDDDMQQEQQQEEKIIIISKPDMTVATDNHHKEIIPSPPVNNNNSTPMARSTSNDDLQKKPLQEPEPVILTTTTKNRDWNFDFNFEPISTDLMLPSTSELVGKNNARRNYYYP